MGSQPSVSAQPPVARFSVSVYGTCLGFADSLWLHPFPRSTPQEPASFCSPHSTVLWAHPTALPYSTSITEYLLSFSHLVNDLQGRAKPSQVPIQGVRTSLNSSDTAELVCTLPYRCNRCCLRPNGQSRHSERLDFRCSIIAAVRTATDTSLIPSRISAHGSRR